MREKGGETETSGVNRAGVVSAWNWLMGEESACGRYPTSERTRVCLHYAYGLYENDRQTRSELGEKLLGAGRKECFSEIWKLKRDTDCIIQ